MVTHVLWFGVFIGYFNQFSPPYFLINYYGTIGSPPPTPIYFVENQTKIKSNNLTDNRNIKNDADVRPGGILPPWTKRTNNFV